jgi:hypothetical protein
VELEELAMPDLPRLSPSDILSVCDDYKTQDYIPSLDRAELMRHYAGGCLHPDCDDVGMVSDNNWLMGYKYLQRAYRQLFGLYTSDAGLVEIRVKKAITPERRRLVERVGNRRVNQVIRESRRFRFAYASCCGDAVIYGSPYLFKFDPHDWCPRFAGFPLMPRNAPADVSDPAFSRWAFAGKLTGKDIMAQLKRASRSSGKGKWNVNGLKDALKQLALEHGPNEDRSFNYELDQDDPQKIEEALQTRSIWHDVLGSRVLVYYFFQKQLDGTIDLSIINRFDESVIDIPTSNGPRMKISRSDKAKKGDWNAELFYQKSRFKDVKECLWPMLLDVTFGGEAMAHRVMGLGRLNYDLDRMQSQVINAIYAGQEHRNTPRYHADQAAIPQLEKLLARGIRAGSILPNNIQPFPVEGSSRDSNSFFSLLSLFDMAQGSNAASHASSQGAPRGSKELEVVALERQQQNMQAITSRMEDWSEMGQPMAEEMVAALTTKGRIVRGDRGWAEKERLEELLAEDGVLIDELDPSLITVRFRKHLGSGDAQVRLQRAEKKMAILSQYPPESQVIILREYTEAIDESYERANELVPFQQTPNRDQLDAAQLQTNSAMSTGIPPRPNNTDIPEIHANAHLTAAQGVLEVNQQGGLDPSLTQGVAALLEHAIMDAQMVAAKGNVGLAKQFIDQAAQLSQVAQQMAQPLPMPKEQVELELKQRNQALQEQKREDAVAKSSRSQEHRESVDQQRLSLQMHGEARKDRELALKEEDSLKNA